MTALESIPQAAAKAASVTRRIDPITRPLAEIVPHRTDVLAMMHHGDGVVGWGSFAHLSVTGSDAAAQIQRWFTDVVAGLRIDDPLGVGGPVVFVSLGFDHDDTSVAVIPEVVVGRRDGLTFCTTLGEANIPTALAAVPPLESPGMVVYSDATLSVAGYTEAVAAAVRQIRAADEPALQKVVLCHDLTATTENPVDERFVLTALARQYPTCWTFAVDGLVGASPEMLVRRTGRQVLSRVLAGTGWAERVDDEVSANLLASNKNQQEHRYAADWVAASLQQVCQSVDAPSQPRPLVLANLTHLATDITGELADPALSALEIAALLHPTPAVGGTPTSLALQTIRELEPIARGRYAAPVGWQDTRGDGHFALALRCAEVDGHNVRLIAGGGIVADSQPDVEAREVHVKMIPVRDALESG